MSPELRRRSLLEHLAAGGVGPVALARIAPRLARAVPDDPGTWTATNFVRRAGEALGAPGDMTEELVAVVALYYAAIDLADDIADGDAEGDARLAAGDVQRLLLAAFSRLAVAAPIPAGLRATLAAELAHAGLRMWEGQERDLLDTGRPVPVDRAWRTAEQKSGEEFGGLLACLALLAGREPEPWRACGRSIGTLLQLFSDLQDLFDPQGGRDWGQGKSSIPLACGLSDERVGPTLRAWMAGARDEPREIHQGLLARADLGACLDRAEREHLAVLQGQADALGAIVTELRAMLDRWRQRLRPTPTSPALPDLGLEEARQQAAAAAWAFVQADPTLRDTVEVHRWGLFDRPLVTGGTFGRLFSLDALADVGLELPEARAEVRALRDADGWRYYERRAEIPPDADTLGFASRVFRDEEDAARLLATQGPDGLWPTWLDPQVGARWEPGLCLATNASALRGLAATVGSEHPAVRRGIAALEQTIADRGPRSPHYSPRLEEALVARCLLEHADATGGARGAWLGGWLDRGAAALEDARLDGDLPGACLVATQLARAGALVDVNPLLRWLVDAQLESGGFPPGAIFVTLGRRGRRARYRSGVVTTILALVVLRDLRATPMVRVGGGQRGGSHVMSTP